MAAPAFTPESRMLIDGKLADAASGRTYANVNPATEELIGEAADGVASDMHRAIDAARRAFDETDWATNHAFRRRCLEQLQQAIDGELDELREELIAEVGCPRALTYGPQLDLPLADALRWPAQYIDEFEWERELPEGEVLGIRSRRGVVKEPVGVVGLIVPWNFPFEVTINKVAQSLATGNTAVLKPAPDTPFNGTRLGRLVAEHTDIPPGVFNVVTTLDNSVAEELTLSSLVDMISFTGSTAVGKRIMEKGAATLKRVFLELGGKSALIVLEDADLATVLPSASMACMHAGQGCSLQTRVLLPRSRYAEGIEILSAAIAAFPYGDPQSMEVMMGPLVSAKQRARVLGYIETGVHEGARVVVGGGRPAHLPKGWYVEPTLFADVDNSMTIAREEIFGPVIVAIPFEDEDDAVRIANDSPYGLGGGVHAGTEARATAVARRVRAGALTVNGGICYGADAPYGGFKTSGIGRQNGIEGFEQYLETKAIAWATKQ